MLCGRSGWREPPDFLDWYLVAAGQSKVPDPFHLWAGLALLAAAVQNRVWYEKFKGHRLYPNLFIMLIGPSGTGKNMAIRTGHKLVEQLPDTEHDLIQPFRGKITPQALITRLGDPRLPSHIWLLTPELSMAIGSGTKADEWVKHLTELYEGDYVLNEATRTGGHTQVVDPCINWIAGSTREWLLDSVSREAILSGFFARVCAVQGQRSSTRLLNPTYPPNHGEIVAWMVAYLHQLTHVKGPVRMDEAAAALREHWFFTRPEPTDELLWPFWERQDDLVLKVATLCALADNHSRVIRQRHMEDAIALTTWLYETMPELLNYAYRTADTDAMDFILEWVRHQPDEWVGHSKLVKAASNRGIVAERLKTAIATLIDRGDLERKVTPGGGKHYRLRTPTEGS